MRVARRRLLAGLAALGATALIAGCGGGSDSGDAGDYREAADAICADTERQTDALEAPTTASELAPFLRQGLTIERGALDKLRALEPPSDLEASHDRAVQLIDDRLELTDAATDRIEGGEDAETVIKEATPKIDAAQDELNTLAQDLGLTVCGSSDDTTSTTSTTTAPADTGGTTAAPPSTAADAAQYAEDVQAAAAALQGFGEVLQSSTSLEDLRAKVPEAQESLDEFDAAITKLDAYSLDNTDLERQRAGLAETGPKVSDVLRRFLDAASSGDLAAVSALVPEVTQTITEFQAAVTAGATP